MWLTILKVLSSLSGLLPYINKFTPSSEETKMPTWFYSKLFQIGAVLVLVAIVIGSIYAYREHVYNLGVDAGIAKENKAWTDRETERVAEKNKKIDALEKAASNSADAYAASLAESNAKIRDLNAKLANSKVNTTIYTKDDKPVPCKIDSDIYLGSEFSKLWNEYNTGVMK